MSPGWRRRRQPDGVLYFHRATGLNVLLDEVPVAPEEVDRVPRYVQLALLDACNLRCSFCYAPKSPARWGVDEVLGLCRGLDAWGVLEVALAGGEPFAFPGFEELLTALWDTTGLAVHVTTNGLLVPEGFGQRMRGRLGQVRVSVDGTGALYERMRGAPFPALQEGLRRLRGLNLGLNLLATDETLAALDEYLEFAREAKIPDLLFLRPWGPGESLLSEPWRERASAAVARAVDTGFRVSLSCNFGDLGQPTLFAGGCGAGREYLFVGSDRRVRGASSSPTSHGFGSVEELAALYRSGILAGGCPCPL